LWFWGNDLCMKFSKWARVWKFLFLMQMGGQSLWRSNNVVDKMTHLVSQPLPSVTAHIN
jgi:hypothetical protein